MVLDSHALLGVTEMESLGSQVVQTSGPFAYGNKPIKISLLVNLRVHCVSPILP